MRSSDKPGGKAKKTPVADKKPPVAKLKAQGGSKAPAKAKSPKVPAAQSTDDDWGQDVEEAIEGLSIQQTRFVMEYAKGRKGVQAYYAAYGTHVTPASAASGAYDLLRKPEIRKAVRIISNSIIREYRTDPEFILQELGKMAYANVDDVLQIQDDGSVITDLSMADRDFLGAVEHIETEEFFESETDADGEPKSRKGQKVKIKMVSRRAVLNDLAKIQKMFETNFSPRAETAKIMQDLEEGTIDFLAAAYRFTALGLPLPEVIKIQLSKGEGDGESDDTRTPKSDAELDKAYHEAMAAADKQRETFLPERQAEVVQLKEDLKAQESFGPGGVPKEGAMEFESF